MGKVQPDQSRRWEQGFSVIELMIGVAVLAILVALAAPSLTSVINNNRLAAQANEFVTALQLARSEAVRLNSAVSVCHSSNGTSCSAAGDTWSGWITIVDATDEVLRGYVLDGPVELTSEVDAMTFGGDGLARAAAGGALLAVETTVCLPTTQPAQNQRIVEIRSGSRISTRSEDGGGECP